MKKQPDRSRDPEGVSSFAHALRGVLNRVSEGFMWVGAGLLIMVTLLTVSDSFGRYFLNSPIVGSIEIVRLLLAVIAFSAMVYIASRDGNVKVDILVSRFPQRARQVLTFIMTFISAGALAAVSWQLWLAAEKAIRDGQASGALKIPFAPFKFAVAVCAGLICLLLLVSLFRYREKR